MIYIVFLIAFFCFCPITQGQPKETELPKFDPSVIQKQLDNKGPEASCGFTFPNQEYPNGTRTKCPDPGPSQLFKSDDNNGSIYGQDLMRKFHQQNF